jgi:hypothetical protein
MNNNVIIIDKFVSNIDESTLETISNLQLKAKNNTNQNRYNFLMKTKARNNSNRIKQDK